MNPSTIPTTIALSAILAVSSYAQTLVPFAQPAYYGGITGSGSNSAAFADVNADGHLDVVTVSGLPGGLSLLKGNGTGGFLAEVRINEGSAFYSGALQAFDYDSDGDTDLLTGEYDLDTAFGSASNGAVVIYLNNGSGVFTRQVLFGGLSSAASRVIAQDLNGDGRRDLLQMSNATTLVMLPGLVGGGFGTAVTISSGSNISSIWVADLNADGDNDIVAHDGTGNQMMFFANDGTALFAAPQVLAAPTFLSSLEVADFTGDGRVDAMVTYNAGTRQAQLYTQQPDTSFGAYAGFPALGDQIYRVFLADLNKDSVPDLFSVSFSGNYRPRWSPGIGSGSYGAPQLIDTGLGFPTAFHVADLDGDTHQDVLLANATTAKSIAIYINKTGEDPMVLLPPASRSYVLNDSMELSLYFGLPVTVTGTPRVALQMGSNTVYANYVSGSGTPTLLFRYTVAATDLDLDGVQLASAAIDLNGGTLKNPNNGDAQLTFPNLTFSGVVVNGAGPLVQNITRLDPTPTNAPTVRFQVQFAEDVTGVDAADFELKQDAGDLDGGAVVSVTGSGSSYQVTATTGTGSGTLGLSVKGTATINDLAGDPLAKGFIGGQVYTLKRGAPVTIDAFFTDLHADYRPIWDNGEITFVMDADAGAVETSAAVIPSNEVMTYAAPNSIIARPAAATYDFIGVASGANMYLLPSSQKVGVPFMGMSGESVPTGTFARYQPADSRITSVNAYMKIQMVAMRSSSGGHMSVYTIASGNPRVWMATSDGISSTDAFYQTPGSHSHRNVAFSAPGTYEVDVFVSGYRDSNGNTTYEPTVDPYIESGIFTMVFGVDFPGQWRQENFGAATNSGNGASNADPDFDGVSNLLEFAFGLNPTASSPSPLSLAPGNMVASRGVPAWVTTETENHAVFLRRKDRIAAGLEYAVQISGDLTAWQNLIATPEVIGTDGDMEVVRVPIPVPSEGETSQFMRVNVTSSH